MNIFNSLGSNYTLWYALQVLFSFGSGARSKLKAYLRKRYGGTPVLVYKGRDALTLALETLPEKGDIAFNGYTCLAVYEAIVECGHTPLPLDIDGSALDFSAHTLLSAVESSDVKAVIVQNTLGFPCDMQAIEKICRDNDIVLIEDLAHSIGTIYGDGREAGTVGDFTVLSFSQDKVVDAVSGGALIIRNAAYQATEPAQRVGIVQQLKDRLYPFLSWTIRAAYLLGVGRVYHACIKALGVLSTPFGKKFGPRVLPEWYCRAILDGFTKLSETEAHRSRIADVYERELKSGVNTKGASNLRYPLRLDGRDELIAELREHGVHVSDIWYDAPIAPKKYQHLTAYDGECPNAEEVSAKMLNLPTHVQVSEHDAIEIARLTKSFIIGSQRFKVHEVTEPRPWQQFLDEIKPHSFLQSWRWGETNIAEGSKVIRLGAFENERLVGVALLIKVIAKRGAFLLCPHGPIASGQDAATIEKTLLRRAIALAKSEGCDFLRVCPIALANAENCAIYAELGFRDAPIHMHPELSWMLDITKPEEELLKEMRKTTRYLIRKMEKDGIQIEISTDPDDIDTFWPVYQATAERQHFTSFKKKNLRKEFDIFSGVDRAAFFFGKQNGDVVAAAIIIFWGDQAFYHHSGSLPNGSNVSYLLQWRVIQEAKRRGCTLYNFWGISPEDKPKHPWAGLSLFKKGFGGFAEEYVHAQDKPLTEKYWINFAVETFRRLKRGL